MSCVVSKQFNQSRPIRLAITAFFMRSRTKSLLNVFEYLEGELMFLKHEKARRDFEPKRLVYSIYSQAVLKDNVTSAEEDVIVDVNLA